MTEGDGLPRVKVCGMCSEEDVVAAVAAGCDAVGLVGFAGSPRAVGVERARDLVAVAGRAIAVAVLVDGRVEEALGWVERAGVRAVQLCGRERPEEWRGFPVPLLKRVAVDAGALEEMEVWEGVASLFVLDHPSGPGGSGREVELERAARLARVAPCLLAGGLDEGNVAGRVRAVAPFGVDASSRLEVAPGRKDRERVGLFVRRAREALRAAEVRP